MVGLWANDVARLGRLQTLTPLERAATLLVWTVGRRWQVRVRGEAEWVLAVAAKVGIKWAVRVKRWGLGKEARSEAERR